MPDVRVTALVASHDRRESTLRCLMSWFAQNAPGTSLSAVVVDDGSTDGTAAALRERFDAVDVVFGDGTLFWAAGMACAERRARAAGSPDFLVWLNDDVELRPDALQTLLATSRTLPAPLHVVAGAVCDPATGAATYGGVRRRDWHPLRFALVPPGPEPVEVDAVHGNVLLVPAVTYERLGAIDGRFEHAYADFDYALRLRQLGGTAWLAPGHVGTCPANRTAAARRTAPWRERWSFLLSPKGMPVRSHLRYLRRHGGRLWPVVAVAPYVRAAVHGPWGRRVAEGKP